MCKIHTQNFLNSDILDTPIAILLSTKMGIYDYVPQVRNFHN